MTFYLLLPLLLTLGIAVATQWSIGARSTTSLGRVAAVFVTAQVLVTSLAIGVILVSLEQPREQRCQSDGRLGIVVIVLLFAAATLGGVVLAAVIAD